MSQIMIRIGRWGIVFTALMCIYGTLALLIYDVVGHKPLFVQTKWFQSVHAEDCAITIENVVETDVNKN